MTSRYRAFLSYSHSDEALAGWLHRELERWRVPKDLIGRPTPKGPIPANLRPIFRDRDDFAGGASLREATVAALAESEFLAVLCSPAAAQCSYVKEEVRLFKSLGRADRVVPVIVAGEPGDAEQECFPDPVKYRLNDEGQVSNEKAEPNAADMREKGDGRTRVLAKVVAGLLGVTFDEIARRAEQARRRRVALASGFGTGAFLFATAFAAYALRESYRAGIALDRSMFAISGMINRTDSLDDSSDLVETRAEMLMTQCDLLQGLAQQRGIIEPDVGVVCRSESPARPLFHDGRQPR